MPRNLLVGSAQRSARPSPSTLVAPGHGPKLCARLPACCVESCRRRGAHVAAARASGRLGRQSVRKGKFGRSPRGGGRAEGQQGRVVETSTNKYTRLLCN
eukprot:22875-Chlamydomonas_euryale.AAC.2